MNIVPAAPLKPGWCAVHSTLSRLLSARSVPNGWDYRPVRIDCEGTRAEPAEDDLLLYKWSRLFVGREWSSQFGGGALKTHSGIIEAHFFIEPKNHHEPLNVS